MKSSKVLLIVAILSLTLASVYSDDCGPHEYFNECGPMFEVICAKREMIYGPNNGCVPGCYCEQGFIREFQGGSCITDWECEERFPSTGDCPTGSDCEDFFPLK
uniref:TIL domain-containing protein n=1 Tax=Anopheles culicifacies TaxID=139723 RepID=A0A182MH68_9DIPT